MASALILELSRVPVRVRPEAKGDLAMGSPTQTTNTSFRVSALDFVLEREEIRPRVLKVVEAHEIIRSVIEMVSPQIEFLGRFRPLREVLAGYEDKGVLFPQVVSIPYPGWYSASTKMAWLLQCEIDTSMASGVQRFLHITVNRQLVCLDIDVNLQAKRVRWWLVPLEIEQVFEYFPKIGGNNADFQEVTAMICSILRQVVDDTVATKLHRLRSMQKMGERVSRIVERVGKLPPQPKLQ